MRERYLFTIIPNVYAVNPILIIAVRIKRKIFSISAFGLFPVLTLNSKFLYENSKHVLAEPMIITPRSITFLEKVGNKL